METPTVDEVAQALFQNENKYVEFDYIPRPECQHPMTPSKAADMARTIYKAPLSKVKAFIGRDAKGVPWLTKAGNWCITLYTTMRQDIETKEYKPRAYRLDGIRLETVMVGNGARGKERVFPTARLD